MTGARSTPLGKTDVLVSPIGVGAGAWAQARWGYGATYGDREITEAYQASIDAGLTLFDTAEVYGDGESEKILGWLVRKHGGSWEEVGSSSFGSVTRDSVMIDTTPVCP